MKGKRLVDVLDDKGVGPEARKFWNKIFAKMKILLTKIESTNPSIVDPALRWVSDRIEYWNAEERILTKNEMLSANVYWKKYK